MSLAALANEGLRLSLVKPAEEIENDYFFIEKLRFRKGRVHIFKSRLLPAALICKLVEIVLPHVDWVILVNLKNLNYAYLGKFVDEANLEKVLVTSDTNFELLERLSHIKNSVIIAFNTVFFLRPLFYFLVKKTFSTCFLFFSKPIKPPKNAYTISQISLGDELTYSVRFERSRDPLLAQHVYNFSV